MAFNKGSLARITHPEGHTERFGDGSIRVSSLGMRAKTIKVWRRATAADDTAWRERQHEAARLAEARGEDTFGIYRDSAGESRLPPQSVFIDFELGDVVTIIRGRCRASLGYTTIPGCAEVMLPNGSVGFIEKKFLSPIAA